MIDFHIHILPGIDDGSQDMEESLALARQSVADGVKYVVCTPHGSSETLAKQLEKRETILEEFRVKLAEEQIPLKLVPGLEYSADGHSFDAALNYPACRCGIPEKEERPILVELPFTVEMKFAANLMFQSQLRGVTLILAHPERYTGFTSQVGMLKDLLDKGLLLQFNSCNFKKHLLFNGHRKAILQLVAHAPEQILVGSDAHDSKDRPAGLAIAREAITAEFGEKVWHTISWETPARLLGLPENE